MATIDEVLAVVNQILDAMVTRLDGGTWGEPADYSVLVRQDQPGGSGASQFKVEDVPMGTQEVIVREAGDITSVAAGDLTEEETPAASDFLLGWESGGAIRKFDVGDLPPKAHASDHENGGGDEISVAGLSGELADDQPPKTHKASHQNGGGDAIKLDDLSTPDDNTDLDASTAKHGLLPKLNNTATDYLNGTGAWTAPVAGPGSATDHAIARYDGTTGKLLQDTSPVTIADDGDMTFATTSRINLRDTTNYLYSSSAGIVYLVADTKLYLGTGGDIELGDATLRVTKPFADEKMDLGTSLLRFRNGFFSGVVNVEGGVRTKTSTANVSNPPTDAEIVAEFGTPAAVGDGWVGFIDDGGAGLKLWECVSLNGNWCTTELTKAT